MSEEYDRICTCVWECPEECDGSCGCQFCEDLTAWDRFISEEPPSFDEFYQDYGGDHG